MTFELFRVQTCFLVFDIPAVVTLSILILNMILLLIILNISCFFLNLVFVELCIFILTHKKHSTIKMLTRHYNRSCGKYYKDILFLHTYIYTLGAQFNYNILISHRYYESDHCSSLVKEVDLHTYLVGTYIL